MTHTFMVGERVVAQGTSKAVLRSREGVLKPADVIAVLAQANGQALEADG